MVTLEVTKLEDENVGSMKHEVRSCKKAVTS